MSLAHAHSDIKIGLWIDFWKNSIGYRMVTQCAKKTPQFNLLYLRVK